MNFSRSAGCDSTRSRSGSLTLVTLSGSSHAPNNETPAIRSRYGKGRIFISWGGARAPAVDPTNRAGAATLSLEGRRHPNNHRAKIGERERVDRVDGGVVGLPAAHPDLRVKATVVREGVQVPAHQAQRPIAHAADPAHPERNQHLADFGVRGILHREIAGREDVIEPADA